MAETNGNPTPDRLAELERENARLRAELALSEARRAEERQLLDSYILDTLPRTDAEFAALIADSRPSDEVFAELEQEFGPFPRGEQP